MIEISLKPETLFTIGKMPITNSLMVSYTISIVLMIVFIVVARRMKMVPGKLQLFIETFVGGSYDFVDGITQNEKVTKRLFPLFATMALFFLVSNLFGYIPGLAAISINDEPAYRAATTDYALIFVITAVMFIVWQFVAIITGGLVHYVKQFFNFSSPIAFVMGLLDIIGEIAKIVSLSFRLFGNIFAGEVIAIVLFALMPFFAPIPFALLGLLSAVIQAFVFPILIVIFINMAIVTKEEKEAQLKAKSDRKAKKQQKQALAT